MADQTLGTIGVDVEPQTRAQLEGLADSLTRLGDRVKGAAATVDAARAKITEFGAGVYRAGSDLVGYAGRLGAAADAVGRLAAEQEALDRNSARLGLDFDAAADAAGRFVDETETMATATRFAEAGVRLTQQELEALSRIAGAFSQNTGQSTAAVFQQLADGTLNGTEALRRFGPELAGLQGPAHTTEERLAAMVHHALEVPPAMDSASDAVARFRDQLEDSERSAAAAFSAELGRLSQIAHAREEALHGMDETAAVVRRLGELGADAVSLIGNAAVAAATGVAMGINGVVAIARIGIQSIPGMENALGGRAAARADTAQSQTLQRLMDARIAAMRDAWNGAPGGAAGSARSGGAGASGQVGSGAESDVIEVQGARPSGGGGGGGSSRPSLDALMGQAFSDTSAANRANVRLGIGQRDPLEVSGEADAIANAAGKAAAQRQQDERALELAVARTEEVKARQAAAEALVLENRADQHRSFTETFEAMHQRQVNAAEESADSITSALNSLGSAYGDAILAFVTGEATIGEALQGMLSQTLTSIGKEAGVKAGFQLAEGLAALFLNPAEAGSHFAAAAAYTGVAAIAGYGGSELAVEKTKPSGGAGRAAADMLGGRSATNDNGGGTIIYEYNAPVIDGRVATRDRVGTELMGYTGAAERERRVGRRRAA